MTAATPTEETLVASDEVKQPTTQPHLAKQDAKAVDPTRLTALSPEVVSRRACVQVCTSATLEAHS
jgi:hypothetical protein